MCTVQHTRQFDAKYCLLLNYCTILSIADNADLKYSFYLGLK
jgi:hypothetical protein